MSVKSITIRGYSWEIARRLWILPIASYAVYSSPKWGAILLVLASLHGVCVGLEVAVNALRLEIPDE